MPRLRTFFAWLLLLALPLQGMAAASMLYCAGGAAGHGVHAAVGADAADAAGVAPHRHAPGAAPHGHASAPDPGPVGTDANDGTGATSPMASLPDAGHSCGVCGGCCSSAALVQAVRSTRAGALPQAAPSEPRALVTAYTVPVPDKPPRA